MHIYTMHGSFMYTKNYIVEKIEDWYKENRFLWVFWLWSIPFLFLFDQGILNRPNEFKGKTASTVFVCWILAILGGFLLGYNIGIIQHWLFSKEHEYLLVLLAYSVLIWLLLFLLCLGSIQTLYKKKKKLKKNRFSICPHIFIFSFLKSSSTWKSLSFSSFLLVPSLITLRLVGGKQERRDRVGRK